MSLKGTNQKLPNVTSLSGLFEISALSNPDKRALTDASDGRTYTYRELNQLTNQIARLENYIILYYYWYYW